MRLIRSSRKIIAAFICFLIAGWLVGRGIIVRADVGYPPVNPGGSSLSLEEEIQTNVRMVAEEVNLTIEPYERAVPPKERDSPGYWMRVLVDAQFVMLNLGEAPEAFDVWFPLAAAARYPEVLSWERAYHPEKIVQDFQVWVDGLPTATWQVPGPALNLPEGESPWATFPVAFPPGQQVVIRVSYTLYPGGNRPFGDVEYILQTGAGWKDTIGEGTITVYLPDTVTPENISLSGKNLFGDPLEPQPAGYVVENNTLTWHFSELEPGPEDNIFLNVLEPQRYRRLIQARAQATQVEQSSTAGVADAHLELARAARASVLIVKSVNQNGGGEALAREATAAYAHALELALDEPSIYSEYARWLIILGGWREIEFQGICPQTVCELLQRGLEKFPADAELQQLDAQIQDSLRMYQEEAAYATQDAAATATQQTLETLAVSPTDTLIPASPTAQPTIAPSATAQPSPTPAPAGGGGVCPAGLIPLAMMGMLGGMTIHRRRN